MARKSSYCKSGNKNINWHPTKVFLEDFWAIIFQKLCMNFLGLAPLHCKSLNHPEQSVSLFILGQNLFNPRTFKKNGQAFCGKNIRHLVGHGLPAGDCQARQCPKIALV